MKWIRMQGRDGQPTYAHVSDDRAQPVLGSPFADWHDDGNAMALEQVQWLQPVLPSKVIALWKNFHALAIKQKALGPDHLGTAISLNNLAAIHQAQGAYSRAEPLLRRGIAAQSRFLQEQLPAQVPIHKHAGSSTWALHKPVPRRLWSTALTPHSTAAVCASTR